jgi:hypothetical protein
VKVCAGHSPGADTFPPKQRRGRGVGESDDCRSAIDAFAISYRHLESGVTRCLLSDATHIPFHEVEPIRTFPAHRRQSHLTGLYWWATTGRLVPYESQLEMGVLMTLDYDPGVEAVAAQPFRLHSTLRDGKPFDHVPDFFVLLEGGRGRVIDVTRAERLDVPRRRLSFEYTARACGLAGWEYHVETEPDPMLLTNLSALAGFRREPAGLSLCADAIVERCATATTIGALSAEIGPAAMVRPVVFHLLWKQRLTADLNERLTDETLVSLSTRILAVV